MSAPSKENSAAQGRLERLLLFLRLYGLTSLPCYLFGHRWRELEAHVSRCRSCGCIEFGESASSDAFRRWLGAK